jgi:sRNA-binding carbon storage regulator CsrA
MLKIKRKVGESFMVDKAKITIEMIGTKAVHLLVDAPRSIPVTRTELIKAKKPDPTRNVQARLKGSDEWNDHGDVSRDEAVRQEAVNVSNASYDWLIEVRVEGDDTSLAVARVRTSVAADVLSFESA